jgi:hypothetical protein
VEFKTIFQILKKYLSDGEDTPTFMRDLISMLTDVSEKDWDTKKDPSNPDRVSDDTLINYSKRGLSAKLARQIMYRTKEEYLIERINECPSGTREAMAKDFSSYDPSVNESNVADKAAGWIIECIRKKAGFVSEDQLSQQRWEQQSSDLKMKYGNYLLAEADNFCPICGRRLIAVRNSQSVPVYEVSLIDKTKDPTPENLLAMCPNCAANYQMDDNPKLQKELEAKKSVLSTHEQSIETLEELPLEAGITGVVTRIKKLKEKDLAEAALDPKDLTKKIDPTVDIALYISVRTYVTTYFNKINQIMINLDKKNLIDYEEVQDQMKGIYRRLSKAKKSKAEIFNEISRKIQRVTLQEDIYCQIVVSYFIQRCEVF